MKRIIISALLALACASPNLVYAQDPYPTGSVWPSTITDDRTTVTFTRDGTCSNGFAWSEATLWLLSGYTVLGHVYSSAYYTQPLNDAGSPGAPYMQQGPGTYWIQYRLVDIYYNYTDQWISIGVNNYSVPAFYSALTPASVYDAPTYWNSTSKQFYNNCYNYAANVGNDTYAQPGYAHGYYLWEITAEEVATGVGYDGLPSANPSNGSAKIAMLIDPGNDFHFVRCDNNDNWSHKPGGTSATNLDAEGNPISNPEYASWTYWYATYSFDQYFYAPSEVIQGSGHAEVSGPY